MMNLKKSNLKFDLVISDKVESKIRWWCSKLPDKEWSGVLYYKYKGSFKNKNLTLTAVDFLVLDIGNSTHTEFVESPEIISYMCANGLINCQLGLIHSHNTMKAFFSGEDSDTLTKEGYARNHFLSLIVNNAGNYVAAITRRVVIESAKAVRTYNTFGDVEVKQTINNATFDEYVEMVDLDVNMPSSCNEELFVNLSKQKVSGHTATAVSTTINDDDKYPSLFDREEYGQYKINDSVNTYDTIQMYNHLVRGTLGKVDENSLMTFDNSLDDAAKYNEEGCYNFIANVIENASPEELNHLLCLIGNLRETPYITLVVDCINEILEYND